MRAADEIMESLYEDSGFDASEVMTVVGAIAAFTSAFKMQGIALDEFIAQHSKVIRELRAEMHQPTVGSH